MSKLIEWEGEINGFDVHAKYIWEWDTYGREQIVTVIDYAVYDQETGQPIVPGMLGYPDEETVAYVIENEERDY